MRINDVKINIITLYHGSDSIIYTPQYNRGRADNDYGAGFYTTQDINKAGEWAQAYGKSTAYCNTYTINTAGLKILNLNEYGIMAWIAEILYNRWPRTKEMKGIAQQFVKYYKINTNDADIIIGARANSGYIDVIEAFLQNQVSVEEVERLFNLGNLGDQFFIKSKKAFGAIHFDSYTDVKDNVYEYTDVMARKKATEFINNRNRQIELNGFKPCGIMIEDAINNTYEYNQEYSYYILTGGRDDNQPEQE